MIGFHIVRGGGVLKRAEIIMPLSYSAGVRIERGDIESEAGGASSEGCGFPLMCDLCTQQ
jgi:hypothetical protein